MVLYKTFYDHQQSIFPVSHVLDGAHSSHGASFHLIQFNFIYTASNHINSHLKLPYTVR